MNNYYLKVNPNNFVPRYVIDQAKRRREREEKQHETPVKKEVTK